MFTTSWPTPAEISAFHCPRFHELPDVALYMQQLLSCVNSYLGPLFAQPQEQALTAAMINHYVKKGIISPPYKKRYQPEQLALLLMITMLKTVFPLESVSYLIKKVIAETNITVSYDHFATMLEKSFCQIFQQQPLKISCPDALYPLQTAINACISHLYLQNLHHYEENPGPKSPSIPS